MANVSGPAPAPDLSYVASVALRLDGATSVGETPDGVRMQFAVHGSVEGPDLKGEFASGTLAYLRIDHDGVGTIDVRAALQLHDGARAELEATGRYDFGEDGYSKAKQGPEHLPDSDLGWCPRLVTLDTRYAWLNRTQFLGVGKLVPRERRVDYDLYAVRPGRENISSTSSARAPLYERLGGRDGIYRLMSASIDSLHDNVQLNRQNPRLAAAKSTTNPADLKQKVTDLICQMSGGPCTYRGRTLRASHAPLQITEADWRVFIDDTVRVMSELQVAPTEQRDLLDLLTTTKAEILKPPAY